MAQTLAHSYAAIEKADKNADGTLTVYGKATDDSIDIDQQICDNEWLKQAMPEWMSAGGNVREQHSSIAAGVATDYEAKSDGHYITALVVDPVSVKKVETGVLKGFSIGIRNPRVIRDEKAAGGRIAGGTIVEISLVDRPANPNAKLMLAKAAESGELMAVKQGVPTPKEVFANKSDEAETPAEVIAESGETVEEIVADAAEVVAEPETVEAPEAVEAEEPEAVEAEDVAEKRTFSDQERQDAAEAGEAMPDGSYPIKTVADLKNAIQSFGRAKDKAGVKKHIIERARALDAVDQLPEEWNADKAVDADIVKGDIDLYNAAVEALAALIKSETDEIVSEGDDENEDIHALLKAMKHLQKWHKIEAEKGEVPELMSDDMDDDEQDIMELSADADTMKMCDKCDKSMDDCKCADKSVTVDFDDAQIEAVVEKAVSSAKTAVTEELETLRDALKAAEAEKVQLTDELATAKKAVASGGPKRAVVGEAAQKTVVNDLLAKAADYRRKADATLDTTLRKGYKELAKDLEAKASRKDVN
jgi:hypothetical protein